MTRGVLKTTWEHLHNGDVGTYLDAPNLADKSIQVTGTFGVGGTVVVEGGNDSTNHVLNDSRGEGNQLSFTAGDLRTVLENPMRLRPSVTAGDGTTDLTVIIVSQKG